MSGFCTLCNHNFRDCVCPYSGPPSKPAPSEPWYKNIADKIRALDGVVMCPMCKIHGDCSEHPPKPAPQSWEERRDAAAKQFGSVKEKWSQNGERFTPEEHAKGVGITLNTHKIKGFKAGADFGLAYARAEIERLTAEAEKWRGRYGSALHEYGRYREMAERLAGILAEVVVDTPGPNSEFTDEVALDLAKRGQDVLADFERMKGKR